MPIEEAIVMNIKSKSGKTASKPIRINAREHFDRSDVKLVCPIISQIIPPP